MYLIRGKAEESRGQRHHEFCLKVTGYTSTPRSARTAAAATAIHHQGTPPPQASKTVYIAFENETDMLKWSRKCSKAIAKQPDVADLSNNHLEFLPENLFINDTLIKLNLRHNALKERPIEEDIYTIGWLDDLPRFAHLRCVTQHFLQHLIAKGTFHQQKNFQFFKSFHPKFHEEIKIHQNP